MSEKLSNHFENAFKFILISLIGLVAFFAKETLNEVKSEVKEMSINIKTLSERTLVSEHSFKQIERRLEKLENSFEEHKKEKRR